MATNNSINSTNVNHNLIVGTGSAYTSIAPSATSGIPLVSAGSSADPSYSTAVVAGGGTGQVTLTNHGVLIGAGTNAITQLTAGSSGQVLQSGGASADPAYSTATFPSVATSTGTLLRADGTNWVATTSTYPNTNAVSTLLYASSANVMAALATANNGALVTSNTGVPSILAGPGTTGNILQSNAAAAPSFSTATYPSVATGTGTLLRADGTNWVATTSTYPNTNAVSTLLYASSTNVMAALATANNGALVTSNTGVPSILGGPGTTGNILQSNAAAAPSFSTATYPSVATGTGTLLRADGTNWVATTSTYPNTNAINTLLYASSANVMSALATANNGVLITGTTGIPSILANGTTGQVLTATTGSPPSWVAPATSGTVTSVSGTANQVAVATGTTTPVISLIGPYTPATYTAHGILIGEGTSSIVAMAAGSAGQIVQSGGASADPVYSTATYPAVATGTGTILRADGTNWVATTATYPATTTVSQILYSSATNVVSGLATANNGVLVANNTGVPSMLANGTAGQVLTANTGAPPSWTTGTGVGQWVYISTSSVAAGTIDFTGITSTYKAYKLVWNTIVNSSGSTNLGFRIGTGGTPTYQATLYNFATKNITAAASENNTAATSGTYIDLGGGSINIGQPCSGELTFFNPASTTVNKSCMWQMVGYDGTNFWTANGSGAWLSNTAVTAFRFIGTSQNLGSGNVALFGLVNP